MEETLTLEERDDKKIDYYHFALQRRLRTVMECSIQG